MHYKAAYPTAFHAANYEDLNEPQPFATKMPVTISSLLSLTEIRFKCNKSGQSVPVHFTSAYRVANLISNLQKYGSSPYLCCVLSAFKLKLEAVADEVGGR